MMVAEKEKCVLFSFIMLFQPNKQAQLTCICQTILPFLHSLWLYHYYYALLIFSHSFLFRCQANDLSCFILDFFLLLFISLLILLPWRSITVSSKSFMKANSRSDFGKANFQQVRKIDRLDSMRGSTTETYPEETFGPLSVCVLM